MIEFKKLIQEQFNKMCSTGKLFRSSLTGLQVWDIYLTNFLKKDDPIFRDPESSTHNCNLCNNFIRRYGNIVAVDENYNIMTMFDVEAPEEYAKSSKALSAKLKAATIAEVFFETFDSLNSLPYEKCSKTNSVFQLGVDKNTKRYTKEEAEKYLTLNKEFIVKPDEIKQFNHFHISLPKQFVDQSKKSIETIMAEYREAKNVFQRAMIEIPFDTLNLVKDLIVQKSLLDGETHLHKIEQFIPLKKQYDKMSTALNADNWCWVNSYKLPFAKFKNELIGVLCTELAEGKELNAACKSWNQRVDPVNYMKAVAPFTEKMKNDAIKTIADLGCEDSFDRRHATIDDIKASEIKHINVGDGKLKAVSILDGLKAPSTRHKRSEFEGIEEVSIEKFMKDILPSCTSVEAYLSNSHEGNMVSLTTAKNKDSKLIFKWDNNYSWTFNGNLAGKSQLREAVSAKGGRVDGVFRFSHSWNELEPNRSLMDLHVFMPGNNHHDDSIIDETYGSGRRVGWNHRNESASGGSQDVDYTSEAPVGYIPVENITFPILSRMPEGKYICKVHNWSFRKSGGRGKAEIEFGGNIYQYEYPATKHHQWITVAIVTLKDGKFSIEHKLPETNSSRDIYGLQTERFHKVNLICLTPNHWGDNAVGNKHYLFMLDGCKCPTPIRSFHSENLIPELAALRKVFEIFGNISMIEPSDKQLSGLGFNATVKDELIVKLSGTFKRVIKIKF
jgi:hypothetical protein